ncbi:MAG: HlyD family type I secretion periplasmic adaptor subunit [Sphingobacteriia bacterium]|nr:HlyD family type I secretion periplasmic adaptor subunit [Sphingobacteriia bacterium]
MDNMKKFDLKKIDKQQVNRIANKVFIFLRKTYFLVKSHLESYNIFNLEKFENDKQSLSLIQLITPGVRYGLYIVGAFVAFFLLWGGFAPINSAIVAHGTIIPSGHLKVVQHLQGGIIERILVNEGDIVKKGDPLIELSKTQAKAKLQVVINQYTAKKISEARILSEKEEKDELILPYDLKIDMENEDVKKFFDAEKSVLKNNKDSLKGQIGLYEQQISIAEDHIKSLESQVKATEHQKTLVNEELTNVQILFNKQLVQKTRLLSLQKNLSELDIRITEYYSQINKSRESINEVKLKIEQIKQNRQRELASELKEVEQHLASLKEELDAAQDIETRTKITAPEDGVVTHLRYHTEGGVIPPGQPIMEIVPTNATLIVEARVMPQDIDVVREGQETKIMITAFKARFTPRISGTLKYVSADRISDERSNQAYYLARVEINQEEVKQLGKTLLPGMPAEVFIVTGERTFLEYFLSPITNSLRHAFNEK